MLVQGDLAVMGTYRGAIHDGPAELVTVAGNVVRLDHVHAVHPAIGRNDSMSLILGTLSPDLVERGSTIQSID